MELVVIDKIIVYFQQFWGRRENNLRVNLDQSDDDLLDGSRALTERHLVGNANNSNNNDKDTNNGASSGSTLAAHGRAWEEEDPEEKPVSLEPEPTLPDVQLETARQSHKSRQTDTT